MSLEEELKSAHNLVSKTFQVDFPCPILHVGDELIQNAFDAKALHSDMLYDETSNAIYVTDKLSQKANARDERIFDFSHENGHALCVYLNKEYVGTRESSLMRRFSELQEMERSQLCCEEGVADMMAILACSEDPALIPYAVRRKSALQENLERHQLRLSTFYSRTIRSLPKDWKRAAIHVLRKHPETYDDMVYALGYHYVSSQNRSLLDIARSPPCTYEELLLCKDI